MVSILIALHISNELLLFVKISSGTVTFTFNDNTTIAPGKHIAYLCRDTNPPYQIVAQSNAFQVLRPSGFLSNIVAAAESDIRALISLDVTLGPKFVRLGFHDCTGGCDGCVDLSNPENAGLLVPIESLEPIVENHEDLAIGFSRADIWALAALVGVDMASRDDSVPVNFSLEHIGRKNCEQQQEVCHDVFGNVTDCNPVRGPHRHLPEASIGTSDLFHFFNEEFGFSDRETVALMGAHTLGSLTRENSGTIILQS